MRHHSKMLRLFLGTAVLLCLPLTAFGQISFANTSTYVGSGNWNWTIYVQADTATLNRIQCVTYTLHPTFAPVPPVCNEQSSKFSLSANGWGTFVVNIRVLYKDKRMQNFQHQLVFTQQQSTPAGPAALSAENWSKQIEPGWWEWGVRIRGTAANLNKVRCVEYTLHRSFPNPVRTVCTRQNNFELRTTGWGTFTIPIKVLFKDNTVLQLSHALRLAN